MRHPLAPVVIVVTLVLASGCAPVAREINRQWPRVSPAQHQQQAVAEAAQSLANVTNPAALVSLDASAFALIAEEAKVRVQAAYADGPVRVTVEALEVRPSRQSLVMRTRASVTFDDGRSELAGAFELHLAASVVRAHVVFRPAFANLSLTRVKYRGTSSRGVLVELVNAAIRTFLNNLNGAISSQTIPIAYGHVATLDPGAARLDAPTGFPIELSVAGNPVTVGVALGQAAILLNDRGIFALADTFAPTDRWFASAASSVRSRMNQPDRPFRPTSEDLALLAFCGTSVPAVPDLTALCSWAEARLESPLVSGATPTFESYQELFSTKMAGLATGAADATVASSLSRGQLANATNAFLDGANVSASASLGYHPLPDFSSTLRLPPTTQLNCTAPDRFPGCNSDFDRWHDEHYGPYRERGCPGSCGLFDFACHGWKVDCERLKAQEKLDYEAAKAARRVQFAAEKAACEARKEAQVKGCQVNQAWLDRWSDKDVGELKTSAGVSNGSVSVAVDSVRVSPDFGAVTVATRLSGGVDVNAHITLTPHNEGHLVCWSEWTGGTSTRVSIESASPTLSGILAESGGTRLFRTSPFDVRFSLDPHPMRRLLLDDRGELFMRCPLPTVLFGGPASVAPIVLLAAQLLEKPTISVSLPSIDLPFQIPAVTKRIGARTVTLTGDITPESLVFRALVRNIPEQDRITMPGPTEWPMRTGIWFGSTVGALGEAESVFRKDISVPMPFVGLKVLDPGLRVFASFAPGPAFRGPGPTIGLAYRVSAKHRALILAGVRIPTGAPTRLYNPLRLLLGVGLEK